VGRIVALNALENANSVFKRRKSPPQKLMFKRAGMDGLRSPPMGEHSSPAAMDGLRSPPMGEHSSPAAMDLCRNRVASQKLPDIDPDPGDDDDCNKGAATTKRPAAVRLRARSCR
jgi:hypothetical protein